MLSKANKLHATTTETLWAHFKFKYYHLRRVCVEIRACAMDPMQVFSTGHCLQGGWPCSDYDQWSCPD